MLRSASFLTSSVLRSPPRGQSLGGVCTAKDVGYPRLVSAHRSTAYLVQAGPTAGVNELQFIVVDIVGVFTACTPSRITAQASATSWKLRVSRRLNFYPLGERPSRLTRRLPTAHEDRESSNKRKVVCVS